MTLLKRARKHVTTALIALFTLNILAVAVKAQDSQQIQDGRIVLPSAAEPRHLTLIGAIELARKNYPAIRTANLKAEATHETIIQAKTAYLPRADLLLDENYGTSNNITGFLAPQNIVPNISGNVKAANNFEGGFGFTTGGLVSWQPFDFGLRKAQLNVARATTRQAHAQIALSELETMGRSADSFLSVLAAQQVLRAALAKVERLKIFSDTVKVLAQKQLKPATDEYLAQAELLQARDEQSAAEQNFKFALAALWKWTGIQNENTNIDAGPLVKQIPENHFTVANPYSHPQALVQQAAIGIIRNQKRAIERTYYPQFFLRLPVYGRGSSFEPDLSLNFQQGYYPTKFNYAISALLIFPTMDIFLLRSQQRQATKNELAQQSQLDEIILNLKEKDLQARAMVEASLRIAGNAPSRVKAAQEALNSARLRYKHQLATVNDVAQTEQLLTQAEVEYATAQLQVWRAYLSTAIAHGDIKPFIEQVSKAHMEQR